MSATRRRARPAPPLTVGLILAWADDHFARTGSWPAATSGPLRGAAETWSAVNAALREGLRGLPGGDTLARLLRRERGAPERRGRPPEQGRCLRAACLRLRGLTHREIAVRLGVTRQAVSLMLQRHEAARRQERQAR